MKLSMRAKRMLRRVIATFCACACGFAVSACGADDADGKIRVGIKFDQPGLGFKKSRRPTTTQQMKNQASLESVTYLFDVLEFGCIRKRRLDKLYKELEGEQSRKRGDDWYMRSNKMRIKQTNSEVLLLFAIVEFLAWGMWFYTKESIGIIMGVSFIIIMLPSALITLKSVILTEDGCEVIALFL